jgi:NhaP-type Na+/H+ or K+/H+ antiporter
MTLTAAILIVSLLWLVMGSIINKLQKIWLTEPMVALLTGIVVGPVLHFIQIPKEMEHSLLEWVAMLTITMALMASSLKLKHSYIVSHKQMLSVLVVGGMLLMFGLSSLISKFVLNLGWPEALLIGAIVTPTDPVVSSSMISGKYADELLNNNIKSSLYFESGINDGLAFPLVAIGWMLLRRGEMDWHHWLQKTVVYENVLAVLIGSALGYIAGIVMHHARKAHLMTEKTLLSFSVGLGFMVLTFLELFKMNGIIGVFFAGLLFNRSIKREEDLEEERIQEAIERLFTIPVFFLLGLVLPWEDWITIGLPLALFVAAILLFRRLPALMLLRPFLSKISRWPRVLLIGWFGPIGVAALFYAMLSIKKAGYEEAFPVTAAVITASVIVHGFTGVPFSRLYHSHDKDDIEGDSDKENIGETKEA